MAFCTQAEFELFLEQAPAFDKTLVDDGILLYKHSRRCAKDLVAP